jgi:biopolymer transport protein ExbD
MAATAQGAGPNARITGINVTPLVDIMLVLLIIFLVTAKVTMTPPSAIPLELPKSASGEAVQTVFSVVLGPNGEALANGERLANDEALLPAALRERQAHADVRAVLDADGSVPHRRVVHVLDLLAQAGVTQVAFGVNLTPLAKP